MEKYNEELIFQRMPAVTFATNKFVNVPIILQYEETPLIEVIRAESLGFTSRIPIYHPDGTYLAKVVGTRLYATENGKKAGVKVDQPVAGKTVCTMEGQTLFEIQHQAGDSFKTSAELYTPDGCFVRLTDAKHSIDMGEVNQVLQTMQYNTIMGTRIGIWIGKDGSVGMGIN